MDPSEQKRLRICLLSYRSNPHCGGQGVYIRHLSRALTDLGHRVEVVSGPPDPCLDPDIPVHRLPCLDLYDPEHLFRTPSISELRDPVNLLEWLGVSTMGFPEPWTFGMRARRFFRDRFETFDVIHDNQSLSYGVAALARRTPTLPTIHHPITRDRDIEIRSVKTPWGKIKRWRWYSFIPMQKRVARTFRQIITVSQTSRRDIARDFRISADRFRVVPNGIDVGLFRPLPDIPKEPFLLLTTNSADMPLKGLKFLLLALAQVARTHDVRLTVVGAPKKDSLILPLIRDLNLADRVHFTGRIPDREFVRWYARASVAVVPSLYEGFGLPAGEAMACGVPVISSTGGALPEVVGDAGCLVPPGDDQALARAIRDLLDHPDHARALGQAGLRRVHERFTWKKAAEDTVQVYRETIRDHHRPGPA